jgi:hypothetical protein
MSKHALSSGVTVRGHPSEHGPLLPERDMMNPPWRRRTNIRRPETTPISATLISMGVRASSGQSHPHRDRRTAAVSLALRSATLTPAIGS